MGVTGQSPLSVNGGSCGVGLGQDDSNDSDSDRRHVLDAGNVGNEKNTPGVKECTITRFDCLIRLIDLIG